MATETIASDHTSTTDEQYVKQEKDEGIAEKIISLANEDEDKHDKPKDARGQATPFSKTEGDEVKAELAAAEIEKSDDSPVINTSAEDSRLKHDKVDDAQSSEIEKEGDDKKAEPAVAEEKTDDSVPLEDVVAVADDLKEEKELVPDSQTISVAESVHDAAKCQQDAPPSTEPAAKETPQQLEKESIETDEEKQHKTADIPEAEAIEKSSNVAETIPLTESEAEVEKQAEISDTSAQKEEKPEPDHVATEVQEKTGKPEKKSQEKTEETEQPSSAAIAEPSAETNEKESNTIEEKTTAETLKGTNNPEVESTETGKSEPVVTEVEPTKTGKEELVVTEVEPVETGKAETEVEPTETGKAEPVVVEENQKEPEKQSREQKEEEQSITFVIPEHYTENSDAIAVEEKTREPEPEAEVLKETNNYDAGPTETEKAESVVTEAVENQIEPEKQSFKQEEEEKPKTVTPKTAAEIQEQPGDTFEFHPPKNSDIEVVKDTGKSELEAILVKEEKPELLSTEVEEKPIEQLQVTGEDEKTSKDVEIKQETEKAEVSLEGTIKVPKEEKTEKEEETNTVANTTQVSLNEEAQAAPANSVEPYPKVEEKVVEEDVASKEVAGVTENPEQASIDQEAKAGLKEESEHCVPTIVEEKVAVVAKDDKKEPEAPDAVQVTPREAEVEIKKTEEENEAKTATTEVESVKVEGVKNDIPAVDDKKEGDADTRVDEISKAVRETLASKFEEKEEETIETGVNNLEKEQIEEPAKPEVEATKESDATKTSKDIPKETPAKPAQKQSNNIISKVKQSLVKAKKAITGKSPSSKNLSSDAKGDIKVK